MMQYVYLCVILHVSTENTIYCGFNRTSKTWQNPRWQTRWRPLLGTSHASSSFITHRICFILLRISAFHWRQNHFEIMQHIKNSRRGFQAPPLYHGGGMNLHVRTRVKNIRRIIQKLSKTYWTKDTNLIESCFDWLKSWLDILRKKVEINEKQCL